MSNFRGATVRHDRSIGNLLNRFEIPLVDAAEDRRRAASPWPASWQANVLRFHRLPIQWRAPATNLFKPIAARDHRHRITLD